MIGMENKCGACGVPCVGSTCEDCLAWAARMVGSAEETEEDSGEVETDDVNDDVDESNYDPYAGCDSFDEGMDIDCGDW